MVHFLYYDKIIAICWVFVVTQAFVPAYRVAIKGTAQYDVAPYSANRHANGQAAQTGIAQPAILSNNQSGQIQQQCAPKADKTNRDEAVIGIAEAAPPAWRKREWVSFAANLALAVVGIFGVGAAFLTLLAIKRQTDLQISKERARLSVRSGYEDFVDPKDWEAADNPELACRFGISIENQGLTKAYDVRVYAAVVVTDDIFGPPLSKAIFRSFPALLKAESEIIECEVIGNEGFPKVGDYEAIRNEKSYMHMLGYIDFRDAFDTERRYAFRWLWRPMEFYVEDTLVDTSYWLGMPEEFSGKETKRRAEKQRPIKEFFSRAVRRFRAN